MKRAIVLHSYSDMPTEEDTFPVYLSLGCPMVSPTFFKVIEKYIKNSKKPIIIHAFYGSKIKL
ncbi:MAG: hypothetical protein CSA38_02415 [Flavobacteriales bacterium]|nr:MAG: hypothetical protein CSA38_02415 [Flavobacteriales bacterium]